MKTKSTAIWATLGLSAIGLGAVTVYVRSTPHLPLHQEEPVPTAQPAPSSHSKPQSANVEKEETTIFVYKPTMGTDGISFTKTSETVPDGIDAKVFAVNEFLAGAEVTPENAKALDVDVHSDGSAVIDFTKEFAQSYGAFGEKKLVDGLAATLGQFDDIKQFVMMADGEPVKTLGENELTDPIPVIRAKDVPSKPTLDTPQDQEATKPTP